MPGASEVPRLVPPQAAGAEIGGEGGGGGCKKKMGDGRCRDGQEGAVHQCEKQNLRFVHEHKKNGDFLAQFAAFADFLFLCGAVARDDRAPHRLELACVA